MKTKVFSTFSLFLALAYALPELVTWKQLITRAGGCSRLHLDAGERGIKTTDTDVPKEDLHDLRKDKRSVDADATDALVEEQLEKRRKWEEEVRIKSWDSWPHLPQRSADVDPAGAGLVPAVDRRDIDGAELEMEANSWTEKRDVDAADLETEGNSWLGKRHGDVTELETEPNSGLQKRHDDVDVSEQPNLYKRFYDPDRTTKVPDVHLVPNPLKEATLPGDQHLDWPAGSQRAETPIHEVKRGTQDIKYPGHLVEEEINPRKPTPLPSHIVIHGNIEPESEEAEHGTKKMLRRAVNIPASSKDRDAPVSENPVQLPGHVVYRPSEMNNVDSDKNTMISKRIVNIPAFIKDPDAPVSDHPTQLPSHIVYRPKQVNANTVKIDDNTMISRRGLPDLYEYSQLAARDLKMENQMKTQDSKLQCKRDLERIRWIRDNMPEFMLT